MVADNTKDRAVADIYLPKDVESFPLLIVDWIKLNLIENCKMGCFCGEQWEAPWLMAGQCSATMNNRGWGGTSFWLLSCDKLSCSQTLKNVVIEKFIITLLSKFCFIRNIILCSIITSTLNLHIHATCIQIVSFSIDANTSVLTNADFFYFNQ